ncbi:hypothetical protein LCGC14_0765110 [marine sediment metagenome]|uniref:Uncharacterized protein n=1 Tax=marine sediment metagenome TaxID=412755 RepID=A0A0F9T729_9ZZZZ
MNESEAIDRILVSLKKVPETQLLIIELANSAPRKDGGLDYEALASIQPEVNMAIAEAKMYGSHTLVAVDTLKRLDAREEDV